MKGGTTPQLGFTIVETLIVLAVTAVILFSVILLVSGKVSKTEFTQGINDFQSVLQSRINEVINGYFPSNSDFNCTATAGGPDITPTLPGANGQGTNSGCVFIGKAIQFAVGASPSQYNVYTIAALRESSPGNIAIDFAGAKPVLVAAGQNAQHSNFPDTDYESQNLENGITILPPNGLATPNGVYYDNDPANKQAGTIAFISSLDPSAGGSVATGAQQVSLYAIHTNPDTFNLAKDQAVDKIDANLSAPISVGSVQFCLVSGGTNESALMSIGPATGNGNQLGVTKKVFSSTDCT